MVWGSFNKMMNKILSGETGKKIANTLYRNTIEAPLRVLEFGDKYGITPPGLTKTVDKLVYQPIRQTIDAVVEKGKKKEQPQQQHIPEAPAPEPTPHKKGPYTSQPKWNQYPQPDGSIHIIYPDGYTEIIPPPAPVIQPLSTSRMKNPAYLQPDGSVHIHHEDGHVEIIPPPK